MMPGDPNPQAPFIGRACELELLSGWFEGRSTAPQFVAVHGEAGVGKSELARRFGNQALERGALVAWGRWYEAPGLPPYIGFVDVLRDLRDALTANHRHGRARRLAAAERRLLGVGPQAKVRSQAADGDGGAFFTQFTQVLTDLTCDCPLVLVLDDLHWADGASLDLLTHLTSQWPEGGRLVTLGLWRDEEVSPGSPLSRTVERLQQGRLTEDLPLTGLDLQDIGSLVACLLGQPVPDEAVAWLYEITRGNPLFVKEIVGQASQAGRLDRLLDAARGAIWSVPEVPDTVSAAIRLRLRLVSQPLRGTLSLMSVLGREFEIGLLHSCGLLTQEELSQAIPESVRLGFLVERRGGLAVHLAFSHPLVGATLYQELDPLTRAVLHRQVGLALESVRQAGHESEIAHHLIEGQDPRDWSRALRYLVEAARKARAALALAEARGLWRRAFDLLEAGVRVEESERRQWAREFADACSVAGHPDEALALYQGLLAAAGVQASPREVAGLHAEIGWTLHNHGRRSEAVHYFERALPPEGAPPSAKTASLLAVHAVGLLSAGRLAEGRPYLDRALKMAREHPEIRSDGIVGQMGVVWHTWDPGGDPSLVPSLVRAALHSLRGEGKKWSATRVELDAAVSHFFFGDFRRCQRLLASAIDSARRLGAAMLLNDALAFRSYVAVISGDFPAADADMASCEGYLLTAGSSIYSEGVRRGLALRHFWQGRAGEARAEIQKVDSFLSASLEPHLKLAEGDEEGAAAAADTVAAMVPPEGTGGIWLMFTLSTVSALCTLGRAREAARWREALERHAGWNMDWWQPRIELARIAAGNGWWRRAFDHFEAAVRRFDGLGWRPWSAIARLEYAEARARRAKPGDRAAAVDLLEAAAPTFDELGMVRHAQRAGTLRSGLRRGRPTSLGPAHLSAQEMRVLKGIVAGLSNRQIAERLGVGERTVETHVSHVLAKLAVTSRAAATAEALRRGLV